MNETYDVKNKRYDLHLSISGKGKLDGAFNFYVYELTDHNQMFTVNGTYKIHNRIIETSNSYSNLPIEGESTTLFIANLNSNSMTFNIDGGERFVLNRE